MKNPIHLKAVTFVLFLVSYLWGIYVLLNPGQVLLLILLAFCCFSSLITFVYSLTLSR